MPAKIDIPQHPAVAGRGPASLAKRLHWNVNGKRKRGVELNRYDESVIGYPIPLATGRFFLAESFGSWRYHSDAPPACYALGRVVSRAVAEEAWASHPVTARQQLEAARTDHRYDNTDAIADAERIGKDEGPYGSRWYVGQDGVVTELHSEYDWPLSVWTIDMPPERARELVAIATRR